MREICHIQIGQCGNQIVCPARPPCPARLFEWANGLRTLGHRVLVSLSPRVVHGPFREPVSESRV